MSIETLWVMFITVVNVSICACVLLEWHLRRAEYRALAIQAQQSAGLVMLYAETCQRIGIDIDVESKLDGTRIKNTSVVNRNVLIAAPRETLQ